MVKRECPRYNWTKYKHDKLPWYHKHQAEDSVKEHKRMGECATKHFFPSYGWVVYHAPKSLITKKDREYFKLKDE